MQVKLSRLKAVGCCVAVALAMLLAACTTTTTITAHEDAQPASAARSGGPASLQSVPGGQYTVQRGDTLYAIAFRNRVDLRELIAWNGLAEPYTIYPGQRLRIAINPASGSTSGADRELSTASRQAPPSQSTPVARGPVVEPDSRAAVAGPSPRDVSDDFAVDRSPPAGNANAARDVAESPRASTSMATPRSDVPAPPPVASLPAIPIAVDEGVREAVADEGPVATATPDRTASEPPLAVAVRTQPVPQVIPQTPLEPQRDVGPIRSAPTRMAGGIGWRWPSTGTLVGRYSATDEARQGIRMQAAAGTPVHATADGEVVYSGNGLVGLGELVIIRHGPEYLSAYGLNRKRLVTEGQKVRAGQLVAEMGNSAGVAGLLHFEVRRGGRPIDPLTVLPPR